MMQTAITILDLARLEERNDMDTDQLVRAHKYDEAVEISRAEYAKDPNNVYLANSLSQALYARGNYDDAIPLLALDAKRMQDCSATPGSGGRDEHIAVAHWCLGNRGEGIRLMKGLCEGILSGSIRYGDLAGGGEQGLLLHYMAITIKDEPLRQYSLDYMRKLLTERVKKFGLPSALEYGWPTPLMAFVLGEATYAQVMIGATSSNFHKEPATEDVAAARAMAKHDLMTRRRLAKVYLQQATLARARGDEEGCMAKMRECYELENPIIESSWYIARYEMTGK
jgi:tetratricopeptide (TPR) repeat protein